MDLIQSASLCPIRSNEQGIEVLLTRRTFWNYEKNRPMKYPGEWVFAGGTYEDCDENLVWTAIREFREELNYKGPIKNVKFLRSATQKSYGKEYFVECHCAKIDSDYGFSLTEKGEVIGIQWIKPTNALSLIKSEEFEHEQLKEFKKRGLDDPKYGIHTVVDRQFPLQTVNTLELLGKMPELRDLY